VFFSVNDGDCEKFARNVESFQKILRF